DRGSESERETRTEGARASERHGQSERRGQGERASERRGQGERESERRGQGERESERESERRGQSERHGQSERERERHGQSERRLINKDNILVMNLSVHDTEQNLIYRLEQENKRLREQNEELNGQILSLSLHEAKNLISTQTKAQSLAAEIDSASRDQLMEALKEQEEINIRLRQYMDKIILSILDHNPSILEIKF
ncbi:rab11 family-interacting protein 4B isoform X1, partial [Tachysurus ichikawai]